MRNKRRTVNKFKTTRQQAPLRRVLARYTNEYGSEREMLECGHEQGRFEDAFGPTNSTRRRCTRCLRAKAVGGSAPRKDEP